MSEEKAQSSPAVEEPKTEATAPVKGVSKIESKIIFGGKEYAIYKLKAAKYYEAQKIFLGVIGRFQESEKGEDGSKMMEAMGDFPKEMMKVIAICSDKTVEEIGELAFPDEISPAFVEVLELNKFTENLKNFAAPLESLRGM